MGSACGCGSKKTGSSDENINANPKKSPISTVKKTATSAVSESSIDIHTSTEILDDTFKTEVTDAIEEQIASISTKYQAERNRLISEMQHSDPDRYLGLSYSDYPHVNGPTVNEMARRVVASKDAKQRLIDQVDERIESSFQSRTADWNVSSLEGARPTVRAFVEKCVNEAFDRVQFK